MPTDLVPTSIYAVEAALRKILRYPGNVGVTIRCLHLPAQPDRRVIMLYIAGLADEAQVSERAFRVLEGISLTATPADQDRGWPDDPPGQSLRLPQSAASLWAKIEDRMPAVISAVVRGGTALFVDGARHAVLVQTERQPQYPASISQVAPTKDLFGRNLIDNLALLRSRLLDARLVAEPIRPPGEAPGQTVLVYMRERVDPEVLRRVRDLACSYGEERIRRGDLAGAGAKFGLVPTMLSNRWPDKVAAALKEGYIAVLADQVNLAWLAPVTAPLMLYGPMDQTMARPLAVGVRIMRLTVALFALLALAAVVALMNYHQEMMPTPFMLALAAVRENAPFPTAFEVLLLELMQELIREAGFHLPLRFGPGAAIIAGKLLILLLVQSGFISPLPGIVTAITNLAASGAQQYETVYIWRAWRLVMIMGAAVLGFFGIGVGFFLLMVYLYQVDSFGVPFLSETGVRFSAGELVSSRLTRRKQHGEVRRLQ